MDFATNRKFFDLKHRKKVRLLKNIGMPITVVGAAMLAIASIPGLRLWALMSAAWGILIVGVPILAVSFSLRVKEADIMSIIDDQKRDFKQMCEEKLDYPGDLSTNAILVSGCEEDRQRETGLPSKKLKSGAMLSPLVTLTYLYVKRDRVVAMTRRFSIVEEFQEDEMVEVRFPEFDNAEVVAAGSVENKAFAMRLTQKGEVVFSAPLFSDDYTVDSYAQNILHVKERNSRR